MVNNAKAASKKPEPQQTPEPRWFTFYDPFLSVVGTGQPAFRDGKGTPLKFRPGEKSHANQLLYLAAEAVREMLPGIRLSREQWGNLIRNCSLWLKGLSDLFSAEDASKWQWRDGLGRPMPAPQAEQLRDFDLLSLVHQMIMRDPKGGPARGQPERDIYNTLWYMVALREIDDAVMSLLFVAHDAPSGITPAIRAASAIANAKALTNSTPLPFGADFVALGKKGVAVKLAKDPRQAAKQQVRQAWRSGELHPDRWGSVAEWARQVVTRYPALTSAAAVARWHKEFLREMEKSSSD